MTSSARDQVPRMLALVPYLRSNDGIPVEQVARDFGVTPQQIVQDLHVLWFCGLPEGMTGDMIDVDMEAVEAEGRVFIDNAEFLPRPFRLTTREALALIVALRTLRESAAEGEQPVIDSALAKLESAAGDGAAAAAAVDVHVERQDPRLLQAIRTALDTATQLRLSYLVPSRDERTERVVDPLRMVTGEGRTYLEAWCHRAEAVRLFRLDRMVDVVALDTPATEHESVVPRDLSAGLFQPGDDDLVAVLDLSRSAFWVAEYYPIEASRQIDDGTLRITLRVGDEGWLRRLALRAGGAVTVLEPAEVAEQVRTLAGLALEAY